MQGELKPNSHCNIKMTLLPGKYPCNFEGEIQCSIDWESEGARAVDEARSVATNTNVPEVSEYLFIRLKKRAKIVSNLLILIIRIHFLLSVCFDCFRLKCTLVLTCGKESHS